VRLGAGLKWTCCRDTLGLDLGTAAIGSDNHCQDRMLDRDKSDSFARPGPTARHAPCVWRHHVPAPVHVRD